MSDGPSSPGSSRSRITIDIRIASAGWRKALPNPSAAIRRAVQAALKSELPKGAVTALSILLTDDAEMQQLNAGWRAKDKPTNVLSFPAESAVDPSRPPEYLGDIALGLTTCRREAKEQGKRFADHVAHLTVHGVLHLLGYDHMDEEQANAMEPREVEILAGLRIANPYQVIVKKSVARNGARKPARAKSVAKKVVVKKTVKKKVTKTTSPAARRRAA
ncbi:rRNA maturation RNase YbeY [uncultured Ferrovibrio sp.]|jgi:metalloprotein, YbeY/UPF0054 family|uniref:rRNA maturation RNase YbeY n=1 Tax=uncultured Ferrovibrio sp. TaxID=1576913 RepID=UPI002612AD1D|nr:rRNA maturation RNase YbeY [uncultured Ferrovibrio sp.]